MGKNRVSLLKFIQYITTHTSRCPSLTLPIASFLGVDQIFQSRDRFNGSLVKRSQLLGSRVHMGIHTKKLNLREVLSNEIKLKYLLDKEGPGYQILISLLPANNHVINDDGTVVLKIPAENYQ